MVLSFNKATVLTCEVSDHMTSLIPVGSSPFDTASHERRMMVIALTTHVNHRRGRQRQALFSEEIRTINKTFCYDVFVQSVGKM